MTKSTITREQQRQILVDTARHIISRDNTSPYSENLRELARISLAELQERRKAGSEPVAWLAIYYGEVYDEAIGITRSVVEAQADHFGWESALTEIIPLYRHAQPAPVVPVTDAMAYAFHHALTDSPLGDDDVEDIKAGLRAALVNVFNTQPPPQEVHDEK
ncbi:TPA: hypothetical protein MBE86_004067 [Klebsiella pneumoniae]|uniref:hypothetical protein n=1 Tax=Klebsiella pneumoniae TaxID=573 RepID=UPI001FFCB389|nr:hypothetical protein [Klebsiella pneumoniae]UPJ12571.1 hypothetical protein MYA94_08455 [Klebsiella pneumoniae]HBT2923451.1 hypothetical protein [Klebsiella pneumoniae]HBT3408609.1 hypothetical protein [Klebsiella pneumoniae]HBT3413657.1 hypothetical protein [Klebsiella pneumoniae]